MDNKLSFQHNSMDDVTYNTNRLIELATIISASTGKLSNYLTSSGIPIPSFEISAPVDISIPPEIEALRENILDASTELSELLLGPRNLVKEWQHNYLVPLQAIRQFRLAHTFPIGGEASFEQIASKSGLDVSLIRRLLRHAIANRVFKEPRKGIVAHTAMSRLLAEDEQFQDWVGSLVEEAQPPNALAIPATMKFSDSQESGQGGFSPTKSSDGGQSSYPAFVRHSERAKKFRNSIPTFLKEPGYDVDHIASYGLWTKLPRGATIVDIGGSHGQAAIAIARRAPTLNLVVQDQQAILDACPKVPKDLERRIRFTAYDILTPQPLRDADVYLFRRILYSWSDKYCRKILRNLSFALKPRARVVVHDWCLPEPNSVSNRVDRKMRSMDISMLSLFDGQERDLDEWVDLFHRADERFMFVGMSKAPGANLSTLEFLWAPKSRAAGTSSAR